MDKNREISDRDIYHTLVARYGVEEVLSHYVDKAYKAASMADSLSKENNPVGMAHQVGIIMDSIAILRSVISDSQIKPEIRKLDKKYIDSAVKK